MRLFIANLTKQHHDFLYSLPESTQVRKQTIPIGSQVQVAGDLTTQDIDAIIRQHSRYGMFAIDEVDRAKTYVSLCYSVGKPVPSVKIERSMVHNMAVLQKRGQELRKEGAIAETARLQGIVDESGRPERLRTFEASVVEENPDADSIDPIAEGVRVVVGQDQDRSAPTRSGRRRK